MPARPAFSLLEVILSVGILVGLAGVSIPAYRDYQIRSDLNTAADQITQALGRAKLLSQSGKEDAEWGYSVSGRVLYKGSSYEARDPSFDELYPMPSTIGTSGLDDVSFSKIEGLPSATGSVILTSLRGDNRQVDILIDKQGIIINPADKLFICHCQSNPPHTARIPDSAWPGHSKHGDYLGACKEPDPSVDCT